LNTEGENEGLQHRPGALVDQAQPTHQLAAGQAQLVGPVDLHALMHRAGAAVGLGLAAGRGGGLLGPAEPVLQGARAGQLGLGLQLFHDGVDQQGAPLRVRLAQAAGQVDQVGRSLRAGAAGPVGRSLGLAVAAGLAQQAVDGAQLQAEAIGQGGGGQALQGGLPQGLADGQRHGLRHGWFLQGARGAGAPLNLPKFSLVPNLVAGFPDRPPCR
jgi:hypothetical protein